MVGPYGFNSRVIAFGERYEIAIVAKIPITNCMDFCKLPLSLDKTQEIWWKTLDL